MLGQVFFKNANVRSVTYAGTTIPSGTRQFMAMGGLRTLNVGTGGALVSFLQLHDDHYIALVNSDINKALTVTAGFDDQRLVTEIRNDGMDRPVTTADFTIAPGDLLVFQVRQASR